VRRYGDPVPVLRIPRDPEPLEDSPPTAVRCYPAAPPADGYFTVAAAVDEETAEEFFGEEKEPSEP
jgi:hypothetical protein